MTLINGKYQEVELEDVTVLLRSTFLIENQLSQGIIFAAVLV